MHRLGCPIIMLKPSLKQLIKNSLSLSLSSIYLFLSNKTTRPILTKEKMKLKFYIHHHNIIINYVDDTFYTSTRLMIIIILHLKSIF